MKVKCRFPVDDLLFADKVFQEVSGTWENKILTISSLSRSISENGAFEVSSMTIEFDDSDRFFRTMLSGDNRFIAGKSVEILSDAETSLYIGTVQSWEFGEGTFQVEINDLQGGLDKKLPEKEIKTSEYAFLTSDNEAVSSPIPILYGTLTTYRGAVKCWRVDENVYLVADHPCSELTAVFDPDGNQLTGWYLTEGADGRAYINAPAGQGTHIYICANIKGRNINGQFTDDPTAILGDLLTNYSSCTYSQASFQAAQTIMKERSYKCGLAIHTKQNIKTILSYFSITFDCVWYINRDGEICIFIYDFQLSPVKAFNQGSIIKDSLSIKDDPEKITNKLKYMSFWDTTITDFRRKPTIDKPSDWGEYPDSLGLRYTYDEETAFDVGQRVIIQRQNPPRRISFKTSFDEFGNTEISDLIEINHHEMVDTEPTIAQIRRVTFDFHRETVKIESTDISQLTGSVAVLGDENKLPNVWTSTNEYSKQFAYLCNEITGNFSNGDRGKVLY